MRLDARKKEPAAIVKNIEMSKDGFPTVLKVEWSSYQTRGIGLFVKMNDRSQEFRCGVEYAIKEIKKRLKKSIKHDIDNALFCGNNEILFDIIEKGKPRFGTVEPFEKSAEYIVNLLDIITKQLKEKQNGIHSV